MSKFNTLFLAPGYLGVHTLNEKDVSDHLGHVAVPMCWQHERLQQPWHVQLCHQLGLISMAGDRLPVAKLLQPGESADASLVCADPIHLRAERDTATLLPSPMLALRDQESDELIASLNAFLADDGLSFFYNDRGNWFMRGLDGSALSSYPPSFLAHRNASSFLPDGTDSEHWRRLMAELQMLLHSHPVNQAREQRGQLVVNSVWFWGGADLPLDTEGASLDCAESPTVYTDDAFAMALCEYVKVTCRALAEFDPLAGVEAIVLDTRIADAVFANDEQGMQDARQAIDGDWLIPICNQIKRLKKGTVQLMNEDGDVATANSATLVSPHPLTGLWNSLRRRMSLSSQ